MYVCIYVCTCIYVHVSMYLCIYVWMINQIEEWLRRSRDSYFFCLESFTAVSGMEEASLVPFLSGKAIANRQVGWWDG